MVPSFHVVEGEAKAHHYQGSLRLDVLRYDDINVKAKEIVK
jgi:hypothetical protein